LFADALRGPCADACLSSGMRALVNKGAFQGSASLESKPLIFGTRLLLGRHAQARQAPEKL